MKKKLSAKDKLIQSMAKEESNEKKKWMKC